MNYPYDFHPLAEEELFDAIDYLDGQREGYGAVLAEAAANLFDTITQYPERFPLISQRSARRKALLPKPFHKTYTVYFDFLDGVILIVSFFHNSRDPRIWQRRE